MIAHGTPGYVAIPEAEVTAESTGASGGMNGNYGPNQQSFSITLNGLSWGDGEYLWIRWANAQGTDSSALAIDDFTVSAIPEAESSSYLLFLGLIMSVVALRRRRKGKRA